jgi:hypothetical protein
VNWEKRRNLSRMARQFLCARHIEGAEGRFDVWPRASNKGAFNAGGNGIFLSSLVRKSQHLAHSERFRNPSP